MLTSHLSLVQIIRVIVISCTHFFFIRIFFIRIIEAQTSYKFLPKMVKNSSAEKKTSPNETVYRKKHFKHIFGGRGQWEIRKKGENYKNNLRLKMKSMILIKKECVYIIFNNMEI